MSSDILIENDRSRFRLQKLLARLSEDDLRRSMRDGWTVSATLAHIAFWERVAVLVFEGNVSKALPYPTLDEEITNIALFPEWMALNPLDAVELVIDAVSNVDRIIAERNGELESEFDNRDDFVGMARADHRNWHLAEIEALFAED